MEAFDPELAIAAAVASKSQAEREKEAKYQEEQKALAKDFMARTQNELHGARAVEMAKEQLKHAIEPGEIRREKDRMAEGYALIGMYGKAVELAQDEEKKAEYQKILDAHDAPDCPCPRTEKQGEFTVSVRYPILRFSDRTLLRCSRCGHLKC